VQGAAFGGAKYGILKFGSFWRIGVCIARRIHPPPQLSVLFTVHINAIVVTIRISIGDQGPDFQKILGKNPKFSVCFS